jgi:hypothetical protein
MFDYGNFLKLKNAHLEWLKIKKWKLGSHVCNGFMITLFLSNI